MIISLGGEKLETSALKYFSPKVTDITFTNISLTKTSQTVSTSTGHVPGVEEN